MSDLVQYSVWEAVDFGRFLYRTESHARAVSLKDPLAHPSAAQWDSETVWDEPQSLLEAGRLTGRG